MFVSLINNEENIEVLMKIIEKQKMTFSTVNFKEFPLKKNELEALRYFIFFLNAYICLFLFYFFFF